MKKLTLNLMICFAFVSVVATAKAQTNEELDMVRDLCTDLIVASSQTESGAGQVLVFFQNGNSQQFERAANTTGEGLDEVIDLLGRLRRIPNAVISNQYVSTSDLYRSRSRNTQRVWDENNGVTEVQAELASILGPLMGMIKDLSQDIRAEVVQLKNSRN